jgi:hypothetical protein
VLGILAIMGVDGVDDGVVLADLKRCRNAVLTHDRGPLVRIAELMRYKA